MNGARRYAMEGCDCDRLGRTSHDECIYVDPCPDKKTTVAEYLDRRRRGVCSRCETPLNKREKRQSWQSALGILCDWCADGVLVADKQRARSLAERTLREHDECNWRYDSVTVALARQLLDVLEATDPGRRA